MPRKPSYWIQLVPLRVRRDIHHRRALDHFGFERYCAEAMFNLSDEAIRQKLDGNMVYGLIYPPKVAEPTMEARVQAFSRSVMFGYGMPGHLGPAEGTD